MNFLCGKAVVKTDMIVLVVSRCKTSVPVSFLELELMFVSSNCFYFEIGCVCPTRITIWWELQSCISCLAQNTNRLNPFVFDMQERETYRWPVRESLKSMLAMGWNIERTKEGEAMFQQRESEKQRKTSESQVEQPDVGSARCATLYVAHYFKILLEKKNKKKHCLSPLVSIFSSLAVVALCSGDNLQQGPINRLNGRITPSHAQSSKTNGWYRWWYHCNILRHSSEKCIFSFAICHSFLKDATSSFWVRQIKKKKNVVWD